MRATACRLLVVAGAAAAALASASSNQSRLPDAPAGGAYSGPPAGTPMDPGRALGLWKTSFGPVKVEHDPQGGPEAVHGVWVYDRAGEQVIGYFYGMLSGNVLQFHWQEPGRPTNLLGAGWIAFDPAGRSFSGKWWSDSRDRGGDWNGWRAEAGAPATGRPGGPTPPPGSGPPPPRNGGPAEQAPPPPPPTESI
jgi:hypothetical protein